MSTPAVVTFTDEHRGNAAAASQPRREVELITASSLKMGRTTWIWEDRIPVGAVTLMAGLEGQGKTLVALELMARLTRGELAGALLGTPSTVVYVGVEDDFQNVLMPRLAAANADMDRVRFLGIKGGGSFALDEDLPSLMTALESVEDLAKIVIDPLDSHLGDSVDAHKKANVQRIVGELATLSQARECGVLGLAHLSKATQSSDLLSKVIGSRAFSSAPRSVLFVGPNPDDQEGEGVIGLAKANLTNRFLVPSLRFRTEGVAVPHDDGGTVATVKLEWTGEELGVEMGDLLTTPSAEDQDRMTEAEEFLTDFLDDPTGIDREIVVKRAKAAGISVSTLKRARKRLGVRFERLTDGDRGRPTVWYPVPRHEGETSSPYADNGEDPFAEYKRELTAGLAGNHEE